MTFTENSAINFFVYSSQSNNFLFVYFVTLRIASVRYNTSVHCGRFAIGGSAADAGSGIASVMITVTDEYGIYNMTVPGFGSTVQLEAWRDGTDMDGRNYTITAVVKDKAGNQSTSSTIVLVPHDQR